MSVNVDFLAETRNYSVFFLAFIASSFRGTEEDWLSETDLSGPPSSFRMFSLPLMELVFIFLFAVTSAGIVRCSSPKNGLVYRP